MKHRTFIAGLLIALSGWFLLGVYLTYESDTYQTKLIGHLNPSLGHASQSLFHLLIFFTPLATSFIGYLLYQREKALIRLMETQEELKELSLRDELTGLYNRRGFQHLAEHLIKRSRRMKRGLYLLYADVDGLKEINDAYGHREGDSLLREFADLLLSNYRESDVIARLGGDEFIVFPVGCTDDCIDVIRNRLEQALERHNAARPDRYRLSISYGISTFDPLHPVSLEELLNQADQAMYDQKKNKAA